MELQRIEYDFTVCKIDNIGQANFAGEFVFLSKTDDEISLVCQSEYVPVGATASEAGWRALKISGVLPFGMVGVIAKIANILAQDGISIFVVSTYNTDYILVKATSLEKCVQALERNGYVVKQPLPEDTNRGTL